MMYYNDGNEEYISRRLKNTYVLNTDGKVVYVSKVFKLNGQMYASVLNTEGPINVKLEQLDLSPIKLGWINYNKDCSFFMRMPIRGAYQQGTSDRNTITIGNGDVCFSMLDFKNIQNTSDNIYPNLYTAIKKVDTLNYTKVAFSRNFAVSKNEIFYKGYQVGYREGQKITFNNQNKYLESILDKVVSK